MANNKQRRLRKLIRKAVKVKWAGKPNPHKAAAPGYRQKTNVGDPSNK